MKKLIKTIIKEDWGDKEYHAAENYLNLKNNALGILINDILNNKNSVQTFRLASIDRINKIWGDYSKNGFVRDEKGIDMIGEIFLENIAMLAVNTELAGHTEIDPVNILKDYDEKLTNKQIKKILGDDLDRYIKDYNGGWRISNFGLPKLEKLAWKFSVEDKTYEEKLLTLDMILNVVHQRSDLSRLFVQGGSASLDNLFTNEIAMKNLIKKKLTEALILKVDKATNRLLAVSDNPKPDEASKETFKNKEILKNGGFKWEPDFKAWVVPVDKFDAAKEILAGINKSTEFVGKLEDLEEFVKNSENFSGKGNLMDKITMYVNDLANVVDEKALSAEFRRYLTFFAKFRGHSFFNTMLIFIQNPNATKVAGFKQWQEKHHRAVKKGAKGIMIFAPIFAKKDNKSPEPSDKELDKEVPKGTPINFRPVYVFDIADTEPIDEQGEVPETPKWFVEMEPTEKTKELYSYVVQVAKNMGIEVTHDGARGGERGYSAGNHINMSSDIAGAGEVSTIVHELAHELMHWKKTSIFYQGDDVKSDSSIKELQAESVAYVVMKHYGLPVEHQPTYLALWKANKEKILANLKIISKVAEFIIDAIDAIAGKKIEEGLYL